MSTLLTILNKNRYAIGITILALLFVVINFFQFRRNEVIKKKLQVAEHNLQAANDEIRITKDKAGKDEANRLAFLTDKISNLEKLSSELTAEVKKIKGNVSTIVQGEVKIVEKPVPFVVKGEFIDSVVRTDFKFDTAYANGNYRKLSGYTKYDLKTGATSGEKLQDEIGIKIVTGIKNLDKGHPEIFFKSDYPGLTVTELEGAVIDPKLFKIAKKKKLSIGFYAGYSPLYYNLSTKKAGIANQITAGAGINYRIF